MMRRALVVMASVCLAIGVVATSAEASATPTHQVRQVRVGSDSVTVDCTGTGTPTVLLFAGFGDSHTVWAPLQERLARHARACAYDRLGEGTSSPPRHTQTLANNARLLHRVLHRLRIRGPLVLAGHSIGGDIAAYYARTHRRSVAGVVMFDATPAGYLQYVLRLIPSSAQGLPAALREEAVSITSGQNQEKLRVANTAWAPPGALGHRPLAVVEHGQDIFAQAGQYARPLQRHWAAGQRQFATMSKRSQLIVATRSGHYIYLDQPRLALDVIRAVIAQS